MTSSLSGTVLHVAPASRLKLRVLTTPAVKSPETGKFDHTHRDIVLSFRWDEGRRDSESGTLFEVALIASS